MSWANIEERDAFYERMLKTELKNMSSNDR